MLSRSIGELSWSLFFRSVNNNHIHLPDAINNYIHILDITNNHIHIPDVTNNHIHIPDVTNIHIYILDATNNHIYNLIIQRIIQLVYNYFPFDHSPSVTNEKKSIIRALLFRHE